MKSNTPIGANEDSKAPWNKPLTREVDVEVSICLDGIIKVEIPEDFDEENDNLREYAWDKAKDMFYKSYGLTITDVEVI